MTEAAHKRLVIAAMFGFVCALSTQPSLNELSGRVMIGIPVMALFLLAYFPGKKEEG